MEIDYKNMCEMTHPFEDFIDRNGVYQGPERFAREANCKGPKLTSLGTLKEIHGPANFINCTSLKSLGNLSHVLYNLTIKDCVNLEDLGGLKRVSGSLVIAGAPKLKSIGLLNRVRERLDTRCTAIRDLSSLTSMGGTCEIAYGTIPPPGKNCTSIYVGLGNSGNHPPKGFREKLRRLYAIPLTKLPLELSRAGTFYKPFIQARLKGQKCPHL